MINNVPGKKFCIKEVSFPEAFEWRMLKLADSLFASASNSFKFLNYICDGKGVISSMFTNRSQLNCQKLANAIHVYIAEA